MVGRNRNLGWLALVVGIVGLASLLSLIVFYVAGGPFGAINDVGNAVLGVLSAVLAWMVLRSGAGPGYLWVAIAGVGAAVTVVGSVLILTDTTGYFLAGLVSAIGFALIGVWLIGLNRRIATDPDSLLPLRRSGLVAGAVMTIGFLNLPGLVMGLDEMETAPLWAFAGGLSWLGIYFLLPVWCLRFGRRQRESPGDQQDARATRTQY